MASARPITFSNDTSSPPVLTPAASSTVNAAMPDTGNVPTISTNKTWVLPPKPKPGRKPAIDTPPTKRKAQNREAQRAFRERRAAKVGELEEEMKRMEEEDTREQEALRDRIGQLEKDVQDYGNMVESWRDKFNEMQMACGRERQAKEQAELEVIALKKRVSSQTEAIPLPMRRARENDYMHQQESNDSSHLHTDAIAQIPMTCGKCSDDTRCQCIEEAFEMSNIADEPSDQTFKRPHSPSSTTDIKRVRRGPSFDESTEIDFTTQFSSQRPPALMTAISTASSTIATIAPPDPCGFCQDGTPCICAEMAKDSSRHQGVKVLPSQALSLDGQQTINGTSGDSDPCINGPGTCAQCLSNPTSTLFCKFVAANCPLPTNTRRQPNTPSNAAAPSKEARFTCADAFTTLSRHPGFSAATNELNGWVPQLHALPRQESSAAPERTAFDIEAASVMSVLKTFDRRFGAQGEKANGD